jgi:hypothetical protein
MNLLRQELNGSLCQRHWYDSPRISATIATFSVGTWSLVWSVLPLLFRQFVFKRSEKYGKQEKHFCLVVLVTWAMKYILQYVMNTCFKCMYYGINIRTRRMFGDMLFSSMRNVCMVTCSEVITYVLTFYGSYARNVCGLFRSDDGGIVKYSYHGNICLMKYWP